MPIKHKILIIDSDDVNRQLTALLMQQLGFSVTELDYAYSALLPDSSDIDLVIFDPVQQYDSLSAIRKLVEVFNRHPLIIFSEIDDADYIIKALDAGADDYITKTVSPRLLLARINAVLRNYHI